MCTIQLPCVVANLVFTYLLRGEQQQALRDQQLGLHGGVPGQRRVRGHQRARLLVVQRGLLHRSDLLHSVFGQLNHDSNQQLVVVDAVH